MIIWEKMHILHDAVSLIGTGVVGYSLGRAIEMRQSIKDLRELREYFNAEMTNLKRTIHFQLRVAGGEGLPEEEEKEEQGG